MYKDCADATLSIALEQYIFKNDDVGRKFLQLFIEKAKAGLSVHLLCDQLGSRSLFNSPLLDQLRAAGGSFRFYNSIKCIDLLKPSRLFPRTHVKTCVVDATVAYIGGVCIDHRMEYWRDTQIRITGPVVDRIEEYSASNYSEMKTIKDLHMHAAADFQYIQSEPIFFRHPFYYLLLHYLSSARDYVYVSSGYFVPTRRIRRLLKNAARRGAEVIVLIPSRSDSRIADLACLSYAKTLIKGGVKVFYYQATTLHTKTVVIDGSWGTVGSSNMDALSYFHNRESNLIIKNKEALAEMTKDFKNDLVHAELLTLSFLKNLPFWKKMAMHAARVCRTFL